MTGLQMLLTQTCLGVCLASDPTPLVVFFYEVLSVILAVVLTGLAFRWPSVTSVLLFLFLVSLVLVLMWAHKVRYTEWGGGFFYCALFISVFGLAISIRRLPPRKDEPE